jgi:hypothetical protein
MFSEPISITVNSVAQSMPRTSNVGQKSTYEKADATFNLTIEHVLTKSQRIRSVARFEQRSIVPDPLTAVNDWENMAVTLVIDRPLIGFTSAQQDQLLTGFRAWLVTATSDKLYGRES